MIKKLNLQIGNFNIHISGNRKNMFKKRLELKRLHSLCMKIQMGKILNIFILVSFLWVIVDKKTWTTLQLDFFFNKDKIIGHKEFVTLEILFQPVCYTPNKREKQMFCTSYENTKLIYYFNYMLKIYFIRQFIVYKNYFYTIYKYNFWTTWLLAPDTWVQSRVLEPL